MKIPVIINNRDLLTWPKAMVEKIKTYKDVGSIYIVDNGSTYSPLLEWYKTNPCGIIMEKNLGFSAPWLSGIVENVASPYYVVTDSDMGLEDTPEDTLVYLLDKLRRLNLDKIGLGLDWQRVKPESMYYNRMQGHEKNRWATSKVSDDVYLDVQIDTTFALYKRGSYFIGGASTTFPYVARHLPWELSREDYENNEEFKNYVQNATASSSYKWFLGL
jgi:hypothetical protein